MRICQVLIALDQLLNAILGGWADETISARLFREKSKFEGVVNLLFFWDKENDKKHCQLSYESEVIRQQLPPEYRDKK